jgi:hypothetical protein
MQCMAGEAESNDYAPVMGTLFQLSSFFGNGGFKGRLIFQVPKGSGAAATHVITLLDSNADKTSATPNNRPTWDTNDTFIGLDSPGSPQPDKAQLSFGAPVAISNYIGNDGDNVSWLERLTAKFKAFHVPVQIPQLFTGTIANSDLAGTLTISGTTSATQAFSGKYDVAPGCGVTALSDPTTVGAYWINVSPSQLTIYVKTPGSISFNYQCIARTLAAFQ